MKERRSTLQPTYFDAIYAADPDPWKFASSPYEQDKYRLTLEALPQSRYRSALEVGCSIGVLTRALASRCDRLLAIDAARAPLAHARRRCAAQPAVHFAQMFAPAQWPEGLFDLILLSEVVYYLALRDVARVAGRIKKSLAPNGDIVLVHWTGPTNYPLSADQAVGLFIEEMRGVCVVIRSERFGFFRLDIMTRA